MSEDIYKNFQAPGVPTMAAEKQKPVEPTYGEQLAGRLKAGEIDEAEAEKLMVDHQLKGNLYDMDKDSVAYAFKDGRLTDDQVESYINYKNSNKVWWYTKDIAQGVVKGGEKAAENTGEAAREIWNFVMPLEFMRVRTKAAIPDVIDDPESTPGKISESIAKFGFDFIPANKLMKGFSVGTKILKGMGEISKYPKMRSFLTAAFEQGTVRNVLAGAAADYAAFDPFEGRLTDFFEEKGLLPEYVKFMTTSPNNPAALERVKNVIEGAGLGYMFDKVMFGLSFAKSRTFAKFGNADNVAAEAVKKPKTAKALKDLEIEIPEKPAKNEAVSSTGLDDQDVPKGKGKPKKVKELSDEKAEKTVNVFRDIIEGKTDIETDVFMKHIEGEEDAVNIIKALQDEIDSSVRPNSITQRQANAEIKKLAKVTGANAEGIRNYMANTAGELKNAAAKAKAMYDLLATHSKQTALMAQDYFKNGGDHKALARLYEHIKLNYEMQTQCYGVRAEFGRGLQMHNMKIGVSRWDIEQLMKDGDVLNAVTANKEQMERIVKQYSKLGSDKARMKFSRFLGKDGIARWLLNTVQANLLWSPATHIVNVTSQSAATLFKVTSRIAAHTAVGLAEKAVKGDTQQFAVMAKELAGLGEAMKDTMRFSLSKENRKAYKEWLKKNEIEYLDKKGVKRTRPMTFRERAKKNPSLGSGWKALLTREGVIDPTLKIGSETSRLLANRPSNIGTSAWQGLNTMLRLPFHLLAGVDEVFKTMGHHYKYNAMIMEDGIRRGKVGDKLLTFYKEQKAIGRPEFYNEAINLGKEITFQDDLKGLSKHIDSGLSNTSIGLLTKAAGIPFFKTSVNLVKYAGKNTALGALSKTVREQFMKGDWVDRLEILTRMGAGSYACYWGWNLYDEDRITGRAPVSQRAAWQEADIQEYSYRNDKNEWVSYRRGDPFGLWLGASADFRMAYDRYLQLDDPNGEFDTEIEDVIRALRDAIVEPVANGTWMRGAQQLLDLATDPNVKMGKVALQKAETLFPATTGIGYFNSEFGDDKVIREVHSLIDVLNKKLDSTKLLPKRDPVYGTVKEREPRWLGLVNKRTQTDDPVLAEMVHTGCVITKPRDYLKVAGIKSDLTPETVDRFMQLYSETDVKKNLNRVIESNVYKRMKNDAQKAKLLKRVVSIHRREAQFQLMKEKPEITQEIRDGLEKKRDSILGLSSTRNPETALYHWSIIENKE